MPQESSSTCRSESGTASVELIAAVPPLLLAVLVAAQIALVGQALWSAGVAARAGARAALVGGSAAKAARRALPEALRAGSGVGAQEAVSVRVRVPRLLPALPPIAVSAQTDLGGDGE